MLKGKRNIQRTEWGPLTVEEAVCSLRMLGRSGREAKTQPRPH